jgi:hypothetical protein
LESVCLVVIGRKRIRASPRFPPPWSVDDPDTKLGQDCFIVRDANGQKGDPLKFAGIAT